MNTVLVTGGAGFIGSHLCERLLQKDCRVINIDNFNDYYNPYIKAANVTEALKNIQYTLVKGDIRNNSVLESIFSRFDIDTVIHLAALAGVRKSLSNPVEYIDVDIKGTVSLLEYCRKINVRKFIFASSSSVYGRNPLPFMEDDNVDSQVSPYAVAKRCGELFCKTFNTLYGIPTVCLRFFTVYGPRQRPEMAIHYFTRLIDEGKEVPVFSNGTSSRDYTYIDDIVDGIVAAADLQCGFEIFNLGNSRPTQLDSMIDIIEQKLGKKADRNYLPAQQGDVEYTCADITKAMNVLGFSPRVGIEEGIERFVKWYKSQSIL